MRTVTSRDGTPIACQWSGTGAPLVLVHGTSASHTRWIPILPRLAAEFSTCAFDRRGRGESGDADEYDIEHEFEDVAAVVDACSEPVNLLGHSYGAICALEASLLTDNVETLILYEPPLPLSGMLAEDNEIVERLDALLVAGDREGVVTTFMREYVGMPAEVFEHYKTSPAWESRVAAAHTLPREVRAQQGYRFVPERFASMNVRTLLVLGGDSPAAFRDALEAVEKTLPDSRVITLPGQHHNAIDTAPDLFVDEVTSFLREASVH